MGVNITTIVYLRVLIIEIGSTIVLMVVEAQGIYIYFFCSKGSQLKPSLPRLYPECGVVFLHMVSKHCEYPRNPQQDPLNGPLNLSI